MGMKRILKKNSQHIDNHFIIEDNKTTYTLKDYINVISISLFLKKYKKIVFSFFFIIIGFLFLFSFSTYQKNKKIEKVSIILKSKEYSKLNEISPILAELFIGKTNVDNSLLSEYNKIIKSTDINSLLKYLKRKKIIFRNLILLKISLLYINKKNYNKAFEYINLIPNSDKDLSNIKNKLITQINFFQNVKQNKGII